ncbi:MAG: hypothetical protein OXC28_16050 [Defluviicoccus sp.]|nr:hypothetical protein [Defluviicoccus sp.]
MAGRRFNEADVDFDAIAGDLAKLRPPRLTLEDVLARLREPMIEKRRQGVSVAQIREVLKARGIEVGERSLKKYLEKGELPRPRASAARRAAETGPPAGVETPE